MLNEHEKREVARRVGKRILAEKVWDDERRMKDIAAEELTQFYQERQDGSIRWTTTTEFSTRVRRRTAAVLRQLATWLDRA